MGIMMKEQLSEKVVEIRMNDGVMAVVLIFEEDVLRLSCAYAPQSGRSFDEKQSFYEMKGEWDMHSAVDLAMCLGDINRFIGRHIDESNGWCDVGQMNLERRMFP